MKHKQHNITQNEAKSIIKTHKYMTLIFLGTGTSINGFMSTPVA